MILEKGWLKEMMKEVSEDVEIWPEWMRREASFSKENYQGNFDISGANDIDTCRKATL